MKNKSLFILLLLFILTFFYFGNKKEGMFTDEIYSYGLSNGYYTPFIDCINDLSSGWTIYEKKDFQNYMEVQDENERFSFSSVYYNQTQDVHPPLYYMVLHLASSIFPNSHSKWIGLGVNLILFVLLILALYLLCYKLYQSSLLALFFCAIYIFSSVGMSTALMIRMYTLLTLLTIIFSILVYNLISKKYKWYIYVGLTIVVYLGLLTQYYFVFYLSFLSVAYLIEILVNKKSLKYGLFYILSVVTGCVLMLVSYPSLIEHLFSDNIVSGTSAYSNLFDFNRWISQFKGYAKELINGLIIVTGLFTVLLFSIIILRKKILINTDNFSKTIIFIAPAICNLLIVIIISPVVGLRYIYNIIPILLLLIPYMISILLTVKNIALGKITLLIIVILNACPMIFLKAFEPNFIYAGAEQIRNEITQKYAHCPCLYFSKGVHKCMTADLLELERFDRVFLSTVGFNQEAKEYVQSSDQKHLVIYVGTSDDWFEPTDSQEILRDILDTGLYENPQPRSKSIWWLRESYILTRKQ